MRVLFLHLRMDLLIFAQHLVQYSTHARRMVLLGLGTHRLQTSGLKPGHSLRTKRWHAPLRNRVATAASVQFSIDTNGLFQIGGVSVADDHLSNTRALSSNERGVFTPQSTSAAPGGVAGVASSNSSVHSGTMGNSAAENSNLRAFSERAFASFAADPYDRLSQTPLPAEGPLPTELPVPDPSAYEPVEFVRPLHHNMEVHDARRLLAFVWHVSEQDISSVTLDSEISLDIFNRQVERYLTGDFSVAAAILQDQSPEVRVVPRILRHAWQFLHRLLLPTLLACQASDLPWTGWPEELDPEYVMNNVMGVYHRRDFVMQVCRYGLSFLQRRDEQAAARMRLSPFRPPSRGPSSPSQLGVQGVTWSQWALELPPQVMQIIAGAPLFALALDEEPVEEVQVILACTAAACKGKCSHAHCSRNSRHQNSGNTYDRSRQAPFLSLASSLTGQKRSLTRSTRLRCLRMWLRPRLLNPLGRRHRLFHWCRRTHAPLRHHDGYSQTTGSGWCRVPK